MLLYFICKNVMLKNLNKCIIKQYCLIKTNVSWRRWLMKSEVRIILKRNIHGLVYTYTLYLLRHITKLKLKRMILLKVKWNVWRNYHFFILNRKNKKIIETLILYKNNENICLSRHLEKHAYRKIELSPWYLIFPD